MRKAVCKNNRQQVVLKKKVVELKELLVRIVVAMGPMGLRGLACECERELKRERMCVFYSRSPWLIAFNRF